LHSPIDTGAAGAAARSTPIPDGDPTLATVLVLANHKGGVAKTTSVANLGAALAQLSGPPIRGVRAAESSQRKNRVLLIDADPQANLSEGFGCDQEHPDGLLRLEDALADEHVAAAPQPWTTRSAAGALEPLAGGVHILPCSAILEEQITTTMSVEAQMRGRMSARQDLLDSVAGAAAVLGVDQHELWLALGSTTTKNEPRGVPMIRRLAELVGHYRTQYDYILIDTPPGLQALPTMALLAADWVIAPSRPADADVGGAAKLVSLLEDSILEHNPAVRFLGVLVNQVGHNWRLGRDVRDLLDHASIPKLAREIPFASGTGEWPRYKSPTVIRQPASRVGIAYRASATEIDRALRPVRSEGEG
jgi:cellulose biosynthesis protein BcsQ